MPPGDLTMSGDIFLVIQLGNATGVQCIWPKISVELKVRNTEVRFAPISLNELNLISCRYLIILFISPHLDIICRLVLSLLKDYLSD